MKMSEGRRNPAYIPGFNQFKKHIGDGNVEMVYLANDADMVLVSNVNYLSREQHVPLDTSKTRKELAEMAGVEVPTACVLKIKL